MLSRLFLLSNSFLRFIRNFLRCGFVGWCMEIIFTALCSLRRRDMRLVGTTSLWMFPIYGSAALLTPICKLLRKSSVFIRGLVYMSMIFSAEFISGRFLMRHKICPWNYQKSPFHIGQVIRLDFAPNWFCAGLLFEKLLTHTQLQDETAKIPPRSRSHRP